MLINPLNEKYCILKSQSAKNHLVIYDFLACIVGFSSNSTQTSLHHSRYNRQMFSIFAVFLCHCWREMLLPQNSFLYMLEQNRNIFYGRVRSSDMSALINSFVISCLLNLHKQHFLSFGSSIVFPSFHSLSVSHSTIASSYYMTQVSTFHSMFHLSIA